MASDLVRIRPTQAVAQTKIPLSSSLKRFLFINLGEAEDQQCQLFEPGGRVLALPGVSLRFTKRRFRTGQKRFGQQTVNGRPSVSLRLYPIFYLQTLDSLKFHDIICDHGKVMGKADRGNEKAHGSYGSS
jgi:hypothetical protein